MGEFLLKKIQHPSAGTLNCLAVPPRSPRKLPVMYYSQVLQFVIKLMISAFGRCVAVSYCFVALENA